MSEENCFLKNVSPEPDQEVKTKDGKPVLKAVYSLSEEDYPDGGFIHFFVSDPEGSIEGDEIVAIKRVESTNDESEVSVKPETEIENGRRAWTCVLKDDEEKDVVDSQTGKTEFVHKKIGEVAESGGENGNSSTPDSDYQSVQLLERLDSIEKRLERIESKLDGGRDVDSLEDTETPGADKQESEYEEEEEEMPAFEDVEYKDLECPECGEDFKTDIGLKVHRKVNHPDSYEDGESEEELGDAVESGGEGSGDGTSNIEDIRDEEEMPAFEDVEYKDLECPECGEDFKTDIGLKVHRKVNHPDSYEDGE